MAEGALHSRPEYDFEEKVGEVLRATKHYDYPVEEAALIPAIGTLLTETGKLGYSLVALKSVPDPKSVHERRRLLAAVYERTDYGTGG